jgi:HK97 family phage major capsid protein
METLIMRGGALKALGDGRVGGYLVRFSSPGDPDLTGDYFDANTDFDLDEQGQGVATVYYQHGRDGTLRRRKLGGGVKATLQRDDQGVAIAAQLSLDDPYEARVYGCVQRGEMGWSSGTAAHLVEREYRGSATYVSKWPLGADASITPAPAEPRAVAVDLKSADAEKMFTCHDEIADPDAWEIAQRELRRQYEVFVEEEGAGHHIEKSLPTKGIEAADARGPQAEPEDAEEASAPAAADAEAKTSTITPITTPHTEDIIMADDNGMQEITDLLRTQGEGITGLMNTLKALLEKDTPNRALGLANDDELSNRDAKSLGDFFLQVVSRRYDVLANKYAVKALSEQNGESLGIAVPTEYASQIMEVESDEPEIVYPRAAVIPMARQQYDVPTLQQTVTPTSDGELATHAGVIARWTEESGTIDDSDLKGERISLVARKLAVATIASRELDADAMTSLSALLLRIFGTAIKDTRDWAFLRGNGVGKPLGALVGPSAVGVARANASEFAAADALNMLARFRGNRSRAVWVMEHSVSPKLGAMTLSGTTLVSFLPDLRGAPGMQLLGIPVLFTEKLPELGTARDVALCDFGHYLVGDRQGIAISFSEHYRFMNDDNVWKALIRTDGQSWLKAPIPKPGGTTRSPFVYLTDAA